MHLEELSETHLDSFFTLVRDFEKLDPDSFQRIYSGQDWSTGSAAKFIKKAAKERMDWRPKGGQSSLTHYVLMENGEAVGYGRLRFPVDIEGDMGNLEFFVPPSLRKRGYGTHTLNRLLFEAVRAGLARALVVCDSGNLAAIRCIEYNRGERISNDRSGPVARFWIRFR